MSRDLRRIRESVLFNIMESHINAVKIINLSYGYGMEPVISDINLTIRKNEFIVLAGCNGSGKTTLLRHLNGILNPDEGEVRIYGKNIRKNKSYARQTVGMVFQDAEMQIIGETVEEDISFGPENLNLDKTEVDHRVISAMKVTGLTDKKDRNPISLSGGEKRKLAIADILAMGSSILVFDEPFANLDYPGTLKILKQILTLQKNGHTVIIATHDIEKVIFHADRLIIMNSGKIAGDGKPSDQVKFLEENGIKEPCSIQFGQGLQPWVI